MALKMVTHKEITKEYDYFYNNFTQNIHVGRDGPQLPGWGLNFKSTIKYVISLLRWTTKISNMKGTCKNKIVFARGSRGWGWGWEQGRGHGSSCPLPLRWLRAWRGPVVVLGLWLWWAVRSNGIRIGYLFKGTRLPSQSLIERAIIRSHKLKTPPPRLRMHGKDRLFLTSADWSASSLFARIDDTSAGTSSTLAASRTSHKAASK